MTVQNSRILWGDRNCSGNIFKIFIHHVLGKPVQIKQEMFLGDCPIHMQHGLLVSHSVLQSGLDAVQRVSKGVMS